MKTAEFRHEIATQRAALLELAHRMELLYEACEKPPREVIHTRKMVCTECGVIEPDDKVPPWRIDVYGTKIQVTPTESEILGLLVKKADRPVSWESLAHACYGGGVRPAGARKDYVGDERKNLKTYIHILRKKLRAARAPAEIVSAWGFGVELKKSELKKAA